MGGTGVRGEGGWAEKLLHNHIIPPQCLSLLEGAELQVVRWGGTQPPAFYRTSDVCSSLMILSFLVAP